MRARLVWVFATVCTCLAILAVALAFHPLVAVAAAPLIGYGFGTLAGELDE